MPTSLFYPVVMGCRPTVSLDAKLGLDGLKFVAPHNVSVGTATAVTVLIVAPATGVYHLRGQIQADKAGTWTFSKDPDASGGTAITSTNYNLRSTNTLGLTLTHTVTYVSAGTVIVNGIVGADTGPVNLGGNDTDEPADFILATSGTYLVRFVAGAAATNVLVTLRPWEES